MVKPVTGSRQSGAIAAAGPKTKPRVRIKRWGMARSLWSLAQMPPDHNIMSRSSTRARHFCPRRSRPKWASIAFRRASNDGGSSGLATTAAAFAYIRFEGPNGALLITGDWAKTSMSGISSEMMASAKTAAGEPIKLCRWFEPSAMR